MSVRWFIALSALQILAGVGCRHVPPSSSSAPTLPVLIYETEECDAAQIYRTVEWPDVPQDCKALEPYDEWTEADRQTVAAFLETVTPQLNLYVRAAKAKRCKWTYEKIDLDMPLSHLARARKGAKLLASRARIECETGRVEAAVRDLEVIYKIGSDMLHDKALISCLVGTAIQGVAQYTILKTALLSHLDGPFLGDLQAHLECIATEFPSIRDILERDVEMCKGTVEWFLSGTFEDGWARWQRADSLDGKGGGRPSGEMKRFHDAFDRVIAPDRDHARLVVSRRFCHDCSDAIDHACVIPCPTSERYPPESWSRAVVWKAFRLTFQAPTTPESTEAALNTIGDWLFSFLGTAWLTAARTSAKATMGLDAVRVA